MANTPSTQNTPVSNTGGVSKSQSAQVDSPWADELDVPETPPKNKPTMIGSLDGEQTPVKDDSKPFALPSDVEEKVGQKVPAANYLQNNDQGGKATDGQVQKTNTPAAASQTAKSQQPPAQSIPISAPAPAPVAAEPANSPDQNPPSAKGGFLSGITGRLRRNKLPAVEQQADPNVDIAQNATKKRLETTLPKPDPGENISVEPSLFRSKILPVGSGITFLLVTAIFLTEMGMLSIGIEKIYGAAGLEGLWGGLSKRPQAAIIQSALVARNHPDFKVSGTITMQVDKSINSPITTPLVSFNESGAKANPYAFLNIITAATDYDDWLDDDSLDWLDDEDYDLDSDPAADEFSDYSTSDEIESDSTGSGLQDEELDDEETADGSGTGGIDQSLYPSYQYPGSQVKDVTADISAIFGKNGAESTFSIKKITGVYDVTVKNVNDKLWVQSDPNIEFAGLSDPSKWLEYQIAPLENKLIQQDFWSYDLASGFSSRGVRVGNEKVGGARTYHYRIDSLEIGNSLKSIGITSDLMQSVSGDVWIGVRDKLVRKVDLKITPSPSSSASDIHVVLNFYEYDAENTIAGPDSTLVVLPGENESDLDDDGDDTENTIAGGDAKRRLDLTNIKSALESYLIDHGQYPVSNGLIKLNTPTSLLHQLLTPAYLKAMPEDPKTKDGWYYGYNSDGKTFTLSARFEDTTDPEVTKVGSVYLHYVKND